MGLGRQRITGPGMLTSTEDGPTVTGCSWVAVGGQAGDNDVTSGSMPDAFDSIHRVPVSCWRMYTVVLSVSQRSRNC